MANFIQGIVSLSIGAVVLASVFIQTIKNTNTTTPTGVNGSLVSWNASELAMWGLLSLAGIIGLVYGVFNVFGLA
jgi:hypothetical protein